MTGAEFLDKMNHQQRAAYVEGALDMLAYGLTQPKAKALRDWYYQGDGPRQLIGAVTSIGICPSRECCRCWRSGFASAFCPHEEIGRRVRKDTRPVKQCDSAAADSAPVASRGASDESLSDPPPHRDPNRTRL